MSISSRDRLYGYVSFSCQQGECERCRPRAQSPTPADGLAPNCVHSCHDPVVVQRVRDEELQALAEQQAFEADRRRVMGGGSA